MLAENEKFICSFPIFADLDGLQPAKDWVSVSDHQLNNHKNRCPQNLAIIQKIAIQANTYPKYMVNGLFLTIPKPSTIKAIRHRAVSIQSTLSIWLHLDATKISLQHKLISDWRIESSMSRLSYIGSELQRAQCSRGGSLGGIFLLRAAKALVTNDCCLSVSPPLTQHIDNKWFYGNYCA